MLHTQDDTNFNTVYKKEKKISSKMWAKYTTLRFYTWEMALELTRTDVRSLKDFVRWQRKVCGWTAICLHSHSETVKTTLSGVTSDVKGGLKEMGLLLMFLASRYSSNHRFYDVFLHKMNLCFQNLTCIQMKQSAKIVAYI